MTKKFDAYCEQLLSEVLVGSKKRNKIEENINNIIAKPRSVHRGAGSIKRRTIGQSHDRGNKNRTGRVSKDPRVKPVYKTKQLAKRDFIRDLKTDYDGGYQDRLTPLNHVDRQVKLRRHLNNNRNYPY